MSNSENQKEEEEKKEFVTVKTDEHEYKIPIMNTIDGVGFAIRHQDLFEEGLKRDGLIELIKTKVKDAETLFDLTQMLLSNAKIDGEDCDDIGMCSLFRRRPSELYTAIVSSIAANYKDCFPFLLEPLDTKENPLQR